MQTVAVRQRGLRLIRPIDSGVLEDLQGASAHEAPLQLSKTGGWKIYSRSPRGGVNVPTFRARVLIASQKAVSGWVSSAGATLATRSLTVPVASLRRTLCLCVRAASEH